MAQMKASQQQFASKNAKDLSMMDTKDEMEEESGASGPGKRTHQQLVAVGSNRSTPSRYVKAFPISTFPTFQPLNQSNVWKSLLPHLTYAVFVLFVPGHLQ